MKLFVELGADWHHIHLPITNKVTIIIPDKYKQDRFWDIILAYHNPKENSNQYYIIDLNFIAYIPLYHILFFPYSNLRWY